MRQILRDASEIFGFDFASCVPFPAHEGGRNAVYAVDGDRVLRVSNLNDRTMEDYIAETEYVRYLALGGASVADVLPSLGGNLVEQIGGYAVSLFERAKGDQLAAHGYRYREGAPIEELWFNTGRTLGRMHELSKRYVPAHFRFDFFDKYNEEYFESLIPDPFTVPLLGGMPIGRQIKAKLARLLDALRELPTDANRYGMIHFDYSDGNYNIDYANGTVTVFDFDNCRTGWYLFDLANLWAHGVGWIAWNADAAERERFMRRYFDAVLAGYRSETDISDECLKDLPLMVDAVRMENIIDEMEVSLAEDGALDPEDGEQAYRLKGLLSSEPWMGFFSAEYDPESPFDLTK